MVLAGVLLSGTLVCSTSQAVNDWFDRHVDAINEPNRPIPSGRIPGRWGLFIAIGWTALSLLVATALGPWGFGAAVVGLGLAWAYSAPPLRLKQNGWWGNTVCAACYEGLPWFTGAAVMAAARPDWRIVATAALYSMGAHGIMTLNDFKSVEVDRVTGIGSLPVRLGVEGAARQLGLMMRLLASARAPWYNASARPRAGSARRHRGARDVDPEPRDGGRVVDAGHRARRAGGAALRRAGAAPALGPRLRHGAPGRSGGTALSSS